MKHIIQHLAKGSIPLPQQLSARGVLLLVLALATLCGCTTQVETVALTKEGLNVWKNPSTHWVAISDSLHIDSAQQIIANNGIGALHYKPDTSLKDNNKFLITNFEHGDCKFYGEFFLAPGAKASIIFQGRYKLVLNADSSDTRSWDAMGAIAPRKRDEHLFDGLPPLNNPHKSESKWYKVEVIFRAPRFNEQNRITQYARFESVKINDVFVQRKADCTGPAYETPSQRERLTGPFVIATDDKEIVMRNLYLQQN